MVIVGTLSNCWLSEGLLKVVGTLTSELDKGFAGANAVRGINEVVEGLTLACGVGPGVSGLA